MNVYQYKVYFVQDAERLHEMSLRRFLSLAMRRVTAYTRADIRGPSSPRRKFRPSAAGVF